MAKFFCEYCGREFTTVTGLTSGTCSRHPGGMNKGRHKLYEGSEKSQYTCKYCGRTFSSIVTMTGSICSRNPNGRGPHAPAL